MKSVLMITGVVAFALVILYLTAMARLASLLSRETDVQGVGIDGANAQLKLFRVVFLKENLDEKFARRHSRLLAIARWSGGLGLAVMIFLFVGILLGYAG
ncbi:hypothetical protein [Luteibacter yeojuensis]